MARRSGGKKGRRSEKEKRLALSEEIYHPHEKKEPSPPRPQNKFDDMGMNMWCQECGLVFNGPSRGTVARTKAERARIMREGQERNPFHGGYSGSVCGKKSCIDQHVDTNVRSLEIEHPDRDYTGLRERLKEVEYQERRQNSELYPEGLIDDTGPLEGSD